MDVESSKGDNCKGRRISRVTRIIDLPWVIMIAILSRLSIKPIFRCKAVCKLWYNLLSPDPLFVKMYQTRSFNIPCILLFDGQYNPLLLELEASSNYYNRAIQLTPKVHFPPGSVMFLVGSCNGFICLVSGLTQIEKHSIYISNPLLGEYFKLKLPKWEINVCQVAYGFCFSEVSGEYKVLRLVDRKVQDHTRVSELEVYTLGVYEKWRNVGEIPCPVWYIFCKANVNGALHWMDSEKNEIIYSLDIETEKIKSLPAPPGLKTPSSNLRLAELGNCLYLTDNIQRWNVNIDIWWMKEYGVAESWTKNSILMDSIPRGMDDYTFEPIFIWKDGEILIQSRTKLASYNPEMKTFRVVNVYDDVIAATRYIPSFYSLKTIMGDKFQVTNVYPKIKIA